MGLEGWIRTNAGRASERARRNVWITYDPPVVWEERSPKWPDRYTLRMVISGIKQTDGPWYLTGHEVVDHASGRTLSLERSHWAEWLPSGDLVYTRGGSLYRCEDPLQPRLLADFSDRAFEERVAPQSALTWPACKV